MSEWFELHPEILNRESKQLTYNSNYEEVGQKRELLFVSTGNILVRINGQKKRYPIVIVYPKASPYALPRIFLVKNVLTEEELTALAALPHKNVSNFLSEKVEFYYKRHQNSDGSLCILEQDNLDQVGAEIFDANTVLKRVREYLSGLTTGRFPLEGAEIELFAHYPHKAGFHILLTDDFYRGKGERGEFYLSDAYKERNQATPNVYVCACLINRTASGLQIDDSLCLLPFMPEGLQSRQEIAHRNDLLQEKLEVQELIDGHWWHLSDEPGVFKTEQDILIALGRGDVDQGKLEVRKSFWHKLKGRHKSIFLGLRFFNRRDDQEWAILVLKKIRNNNPPLLSGEPNIEEVLKDYQISVAYSEPLTEEKFYLRNKGRIDYLTVKNKEITVIGCGAIGSEIADVMGKGGVGRIILIDNQLIHAHNSVRHLASIHYTNQCKVNAVAKILLDHNPYLNVTPRFCDVLTNDLNDFFSSESIGISSIADDNTEGYLNEQAVLQNRKMFYVRALRGGKAARIFRVIPGIDACFNCLTLYRMERHPEFIDIPEDRDLPTIRNECNNPIRPASAADLKLISSLAGRIVYDYLQCSQTELINHWVWSTDCFEDINVNPSMPFKLEARYLAPHPQCPYCQKSHPLEVVIDESALSFMKGLVLATPGIETGGVLVGNIQDNGQCMNITHASGPGPTSKRTSVIFERDISFCQSFINTHAADGRIYLGEWHSHPTDNVQPSSTDIKSLTNIAQQKEYLITHPVMLIFSRSGRPSCTIHSVKQPYYEVKLTVK